MYKCGSAGESKGGGEWTGKDVGHMGGKNQETGEEKSTGNVEISSGCEVCVCVCVPDSLTCCPLSLRVCCRTEAQKAAALKLNLSRSLLGAFILQFVRCWLMLWHQTGSNLWIISFCDAGTFPFHRTRTEAADESLKTNPTPVEELLSHPGYSSSFGFFFTPLLFILWPPVGRLVRPVLAVGARWLSLLP